MQFRWGCINSAKEKSIRYVIRESTLARTGTLSSARKSSQIEYMICKNTCRKANSTVLSAALIFAAWVSNGPSWSITLFPVGRRRCHFAVGVGVRLTDCCMCSVFGRQSSIRGRRRKEGRRKSWREGKRVNRQTKASQR
jgi:hypothetical protein